MNRISLTYKIIAVLTALCLECTSILIPTARAEVISPIDPSIKKLDPELLKLPVKFGEVVESHSGVNGNVVVIQDAHAIPDAQKNIANVIKYLQQEYGVGTIELEGASGDLDPQIFRSFPDKKLLREVMKGYMDAGEISGGTAAAIFDATSTKYQGVEDWDVYEEGLGLYLSAMGKEADLLQKLNTLREALNAEKEKLYPTALLEVDQKVEKFYENAEQLTDLIKVLGAIQAPKFGSELEALWKEVQKQTTDNRLATNDKDVEVRALASKVEKVLKSPGAVKAFNTRKQEWMTGEISPEAFAMHLKEWADQSGLNLEMSSDLHGMVRDQQTLKSLEGTKLFRDLEVYIREIKDMMISHTTSEVSTFDVEEGRGLDERTNSLRILTKLSKLELAREEWRKLSGGLIFKTIADLGLKQDDLVFHLAFYLNAEERDQIFFENLKTSVSAHRPTVIVAGGFHAEGLTSRLKEAGMGYALVMPKINHIPENMTYRVQMRGEVSWKNYFEVENGRVHLYKAFLRAVRDRLLASSGQGSADRKNLMLNAESLSLLKAWRDQIIRDLSDQGKVERAAWYTRYMDEVVNEELKHTDSDKLMGKVDNFIRGLRGLETTNQLTPDQIAALLKVNMLPQSTAALPSTGTSIFSGFFKGITLPNISAVANKYLNQLRELTKRQASESSVPVVAAATALPVEAVFKDLTERDVLSLISEDSQLDQGFLKRAFEVNPSAVANLMLAKALGLKIESMNSGAGIAVIRKKFEDKGLRLLIKVTEVAAIQPAINFVRAMGLEGLVDVTVPFSDREGEATKLAAVARFEREGLSVNMLDKPSERKEDELLNKPTHVEVVFLDSSFPGSKESDYVFLSPNESERILQIPYLAFKTAPQKISDAEVKRIRKSIFGNRGERPIWIVAPNPRAFEMNNSYGGEHFPDVKAVHQAWLEQPSDNKPLLIIANRMESDLSMIWNRISSDHMSVDGQAVVKSGDIVEQRKIDTQGGRVGYRGDRDVAEGALGDGLVGGEAMGELDIVFLGSQGELWQYLQAANGENDYIFTGPDRNLHEAVIGKKSKGKVVAFGNKEWWPVNERAYDFYTQEGAVVQADPTRDSVLDVLSKPVKLEDSWDPTLSYDNKFNAPEAWLAAAHLALLLEGKIFSMLGDQAASVIGDTLDRLNAKVYQAKGGEALPSLAGAMLDYFARQPIVAPGKIKAEHSEGSAIEEGSLKNVSVRSEARVMNAEKGNAIATLSGIAVAAVSLVLLGFGLVPAFAGWALLAVGAIATAFFSNEMRRLKKANEEIKKLTSEYLEDQVRESLVAVSNNKVIDRGFKIGDVISYGPIDESTGLDAFWIVKSIPGENNTEYVTADLYGEVGGEWRQIDAQGSFKGATPAQRQTFFQHGAVATIKRKPGTVYRGAGNLFTQAFGNDISKVISAAERRRSTEEELGGLATVRSEARSESRVVINPEQVRNASGQVVAGNGAVGSIGVGTNVDFSARGMLQPIFMLINFLKSNFLPKLESALFQSLFFESLSLKIEVNGKEKSYGEINMAVKEARAAQKKAKEATDADKLRSAEALLASALAEKVIFLENAKKLGFEEFLLQGDLGILSRRLYIAVPSQAERDRVLSALTLTFNSQDHASLKAGILKVQEENKARGGAVYSDADLEKILGEFDKARSFMFAGVPFIGLSDGAFRNLSDEQIREKMGTFITVQDVSETPLIFNPTGESGRDISIRNDNEGFHIIEGQNETLVGNDIFDMDELVPDWSKGVDDQVIKALSYHDNKTRTVILGKGDPSPESKSEDYTHKIWVRNGKIISTDLSIRSLRNLQRLGVTDKISAFHLTHTHYDHVGGLLDVIRNALQANKTSSDKIPKIKLMAAYAVYSQLLDLAEANFKDLLGENPRDEIKELFDFVPPESIEDNVETVQLRGDPAWSGVLFQFGRTYGHPIPTYGLKVTDNGIVTSYLSDSTMPPEYIKDADDNLMKNPRYVEFVNFFGGTEDNPVDFIIAENGVEGVHITPDQLLAAFRRHAMLGLILTVHSAEDRAVKNKALQGILIAAKTGMIVEPKKFSEREAEVKLLKQLFLKAEAIKGLMQLSEDQAERLAQVTSRRQISEDVTLFLKGKPVEGHDFVYVILDGEVIVQLQDGTVKVLKKGDLVGEVAILARALTAQDYAAIEKAIAHEAGDTSEIKNQKDTAKAFFYENTNDVNINGVPNRLVKTGVDLEEKARQASLPPAQRNMLLPLFNIYKSGKTIDRTANVEVKGDTGTVLAAIPWGALINFMLREAELGHTAAQSNVASVIAATAEARIDDALIQKKEEAVAAAAAALAAAAGSGVETGDIVRSEARIPVGNINDVDLKKYLALANEVAPGKIEIFGGVARDLAVRRSLSQPLDNLIKTDGDIDIVIHATTVEEGERIFDQLRQKIAGDTSLGEERSNRFYAKKNDGGKVLFELLAFRSNDGALVAVEETHQAYFDGAQLSFETMSLMTNTETGVVELHDPYAGVEDIAQREVRFATNQPPTMADIFRGLTRVHQLGWQWNVETLERVKRHLDNLRALGDKKGDGSVKSIESPFLLAEYSKAVRDYQGFRLRMVSGSKLGQKDEKELEEKVSSLVAAYERYLDKKINDSMGGTTSLSSRMRTARSMSVGDSTKALIDLDRAIEADDLGLAILPGLSLAVVKDVAYINPRNFFGISGGVSALLRDAKDPSNAVASLKEVGLAEMLADLGIDVDKGLMQREVLSNDNDDPNKKELLELHETLKSGVVESDAFKTIREIEAVNYVDTLSAEKAESYLDKITNVRKTIKKYAETELKYGFPPTFQPLIRRLQAAEKRIAGLNRSEARSAAREVVGQDEVGQTPRQWVENEIKVSRSKLEEELAGKDARAVAYIFDELPLSLRNETLLVEVTSDKYAAHSVPSRLPIVLATAYAALRDYDTNQIEMALNRTALSDEERMDSILIEHAVNRLKLISKFSVRAVLEYILEARKRADTHIDREGRESATIEEEQKEKEDTAVVSQESIPRSLVDMSLDRTRNKEYVAKQETEEMKELAQFWVDNIDHQSETDFLAGLNESLKLFQSAVGNNKFVLSLYEGKSNAWVYDMSQFTKTEVLRSDAGKILVGDMKDKQVVAEEIVNNPDYNNLVYLDDAGYSGTQVVNWLYGVLDVLLQSASDGALDKRQIDIHLVLPFVTKSALSKINDFFADKVGAQKSIKLNFHYSRSMFSVNDALSKIADVEKRERLKKLILKLFDVYEDESVLELPLTYFQHKVPDWMSVPTTFQQGSEGYARVFDGPVFGADGKIKELFPLIPPLDTAPYQPNYYSEVNEIRKNPDWSNRVDGQSVETPGFRSEARSPTESAEKGSRSEVSVRERVYRSEFRVDANLIKKIYGKFLALGTRKTFKDVPLSGEVTTFDEVFNLMSPMDQENVMGILTQGREYPGFSSMLSGEWGPKRNAIYKLQKPVVIERSVNGSKIAITYPAVKLKGSNVPTGTDPVQQLDLRSAKQPGVVLYMDGSTPKLASRPPVPDGALKGGPADVEMGSLIRFFGLKSLFVTNPPIAINRLDKKFEYPGTQSAQPIRDDLAVVAELVSSVEDERFVDQVGPMVNRFFLKWENRQDDIPQLKRELEELHQIFYAYGRAAREYQRDSIHQYLSPGNLNFIEGADGKLLEVNGVPVMNVQDTDISVPVANVPAPERLGYFNNDLYMLLEGVREFENPAKPDERGRHPKIYNNRHSDAFQFFSGLRAIGIEVNFQKAALQGFFQEAMKDDQQRSFTEKNLLGYPGSQQYLDSGYIDTKMLAIDQPLDLKSPLAQLMQFEFKSELNYRSEAREAEAVAADVFGFFKSPAKYSAGRINALADEIQSLADKQGLDVFINILWSIAQELAVRTSAPESTGILSPIAANIFSKVETGRMIITLSSFASASNLEKPTVGIPFKVTDQQVEALKQKLSPELSQLLGGIQLQHENLKNLGKLFKDKGITPSNIDPKLANAVVFNDAPDLEWETLPGIGVLKEPQQFDSELEGARIHLQILIASYLAVRFSDKKMMLTKEIVGEINQALFQLGEAQEGIIQIDANGRLVIKQSSLLTYIQTLFKAQTAVAVAA